MIVFFILYYHTLKCYNVTEEVIGMYRVALCEDDAHCSVELETVCRAIFDKLMIEYELDVFDSSEAFLHAFSEEHRRFDLMLLDIVMAQPNGMELAQRIRREGAEGAIVFVTSNRDYALQGYDVGALHYLMKPVDQAVLERVISADYQERNIQTERNPSAMCRRAAPRRRWSWPPRCMVSTSPMRAISTTKPQANTNITIRRKRRCQCSCNDIRRFLRVKEVMNYQ